MDVYAGSPIGAWGQVEHLVPGGVSLVVARRGVGKTALAVHGALQVLLRGQKVLHVALEDSVDHVRAHYDEIVRAVHERARLGAGVHVGPSQEAPLLVERNRTVHAFAGRPFQLDAVRRNLQVLEEAAQFRPQLLVVDGGDAAFVGEHLSALSAFGREHGMAVLVTVTTEDPAGFRQAVPETARLVMLEARRGRMVLETPGQTEWLEPSTLFVSTAGASGHPSTDALPSVSAVDATLYSGGALGAESAFGEAAARHGVHEVNLTFQGHLQARTRGRYELSPKELAMGDVSLQYVSRKLNRSYNVPSGDEKGSLIRGVLQTIWHMVSRSRQVFVVGSIQPDGTVVGGTGWAVELARAWSRDLWVFDQEKKVWFGWDGAGWAVGTPVVRHPHLCGTGTRYLDDAGRAAIDDLFARSFPADRFTTGGAAPPVTLPRLPRA